jgi:hypothetical protein
MDVFIYKTFSFLVKIEKILEFKKCFNQVKIFKNK